MSATVGSKTWMSGIMSDVFEECNGLRSAGQAEYAYLDENAFTNFDKLAADLHLPREKILLVYFKKHYDGVLSWVNGHKSQRESVKGRINDMIVYLCLLRGMVEMSEIESAPEPNTEAIKGSNITFPCGHIMWFIVGADKPQACKICVPAPSPKRSG